MRFEDRLKIEYEVDEDTLVLTCATYDVADIGRKCDQTWHQQTDTWGRCKNYF